MPDRVPQEWQILIRADAGLANRAPHPPERFWQLQTAPRNILPPFARRLRLSNRARSLYPHTTPFLTESWREHLRTVAACGGRVRPATVRAASNRGADDATHADR